MRRLLRYLLVLTACVSSLPLSADDGLPYKQATSPAGQQASPAFGLDLGCAGVIASAGSDAPGPSWFPTIPTGVPWLLVPPFVRPSCRTFASPKTRIATEQRIVYDIRDFELSVEYQSVRGGVVFDTTKGLFSIKYDKPYVFNGKPLVFHERKLCLTTKEKGTLAEYIVRNDILALDRNSLEGWHFMAGKTDRCTFKVRLGTQGQQYTVEGLDKAVVGRTGDTLLWNLFQLAEAMSNSRRESFYWDLWILDELQKRLDNAHGNQLPFYDDQLPPPFFGTFRNPKELGKWLQAWTESAP